MNGGALLWEVAVYRHTEVTLLCLTPGDFRGAEVYMANLRLGRKSVIDQMGTACDQKQFSYFSKEFCFKDPIGTNTDSLFMRYQLWHVRPSLSGNIFVDSAACLWYN